MDLPFTTILPLLSMLFVAAVGIFVYFSNKKSKLNLFFGLFTIVLGIWFFGTFKMFTSETDAEAIFWDRFIYAGVVFIPALMYHFSIIFAQVKGQKKTLILSYILSFTFLIISRTDYFVSGLFRYTWGVHTQAKLFHHIFLIEVLFFFFLVLKNLYQYYQSKAKTKIERLQAKFVFLAFFVLIVVSLPAFAPAYKISVYPFFYVSGLIFSVILAYTILRHQLMNIRVLATEFFVGIIAFILLIEFFLAESLSGHLFRLGIFFAFCFLGYLLVRSVMNEIKRREELEKLTAELRKTQEELKKLDRAKSEFLSIASHQLRAPLTVVKGYISMILEKTYGQVPEKIQKPLQNIFISNERLIKLIKTLLDISRIESGKTKAEPAEASLEEVVSNVVDELKLKAEEKKLYLKWDRPKADLPKIFIDKEKIREVILNIIDNAIKYTNRGGVTVKVGQQVSRYQVVVSDTGEGMSKEDIERLFNSFSRGTAGTKFATEGAGFGLYVAKKFVDMHGGKIWAESEGQGKGSTFYIELPVK